MGHQGAAGVVELVEDVLLLRSRIGAFCLPLQSCIFSDIQNDLMSKLPQAYQFLDLSDYGRPPARFIANTLKDTRFTPLDVTTAFIVAGFIALACIVQAHYWTAAFFLILKSVLDAADGELARVKKTPSYVGRYYDSVADILLNLLIFAAIGYATQSPVWLVLLAFAGVQLQGTLYNYYYVILRNKVAGDTTSRIFEIEPPKAMKGEQQRHVNLFFHLYNTLYIVFDKAIYHLDTRAAEGPAFPQWFMTMLSAFGLGFQLLLISLFLVLGWMEYIIPFFIGYSLLILVFVGLRRLL
jgi:CDP-diacylglycerol--serine O-phosphatidyltransferase